jgi:hypothetical protein
MAYWRAEDVRLLTLKVWRWTGYGCAGGIKRTNDGELMQWTLGIDA